MKSTKIIAMSAALAALTSVTQVQASNLGEYAKGGYVGTFYSSNQIEYEAEGVDIEAEPNSLGIRAGYYVNPYVAVEARYSFEVSDDSLEVNNISTDADVSLPYNYGAFVKVGYPTKHVEPYAILGWNKVEMEIEFQGQEETDSESGLAAGFGVGFFFNKNLGINAEAMVVHAAEEKEDGVDVDETITQLSLGLVYSF